ncbi:hypothetical protein LMG29542_07968 [Paraburkholderia humisilvae]|uniref:Uncharacterized protein n=1 Tax=Paraburkholderia humisilvae TaxID=627669 RepID=A0A6J5F6T5_9BURK|nr:hypothetical protein LMG29542_07968 [Paraburkholderia humisilvae]
MTCTVSGVGVPAFLTKQARLQNTGFQANRARCSANLLGAGGRSAATTSKMSCRKSKPHSLGPSGWVRKRYSKRVANWTLRFRHSSGASRLDRHRDSPALSPAGGSLAFLLCRSGRWMPMQRARASDEHRGTDLGLNDRGHGGAGIFLGIVRPVTWREPLTVEERARCQRARVRACGLACDGWCCTARQSDFTYRSGAREACVSERLDFSSAPLWRCFRTCWSVIVTAEVIFIRRARGCISDFLVWRSTRRSASRQRRVAFNRWFCESRQVADAHKFNSRRNRYAGSDVLVNVAACPFRL